MGKYLYSLVIIAITLNICQAQTSKTTFIPLLKESPKIDSLLLSIINSEYSKALKNDSCFLLDLSINKNDAGFIQSIHAENKKSLI